VERTLADGGIHTSEEKVLTRDGRWVNTVVSSSPIHNEQGEVTAVLEVSTNVTEVKRLQSLATVGLAVTGLAHRIKNILMGLKGGVFVANTGMETSDQAMVEEGWEMVERNVDKVGAVATHLLFCSKEREPTLVNDVDPKSIVQDVHDLYRTRAESAGIDLRLDLDSAEMRGYYDPDGLQNLVTNLMANAIDACRFDPAATEKDHAITLRCLRNAGGSMVIEVADNGEGIPDRLKSRVLEGFFSTKGTEGTGLGLMVVQRVVEEHRGTLTLTSSEGVGSTVRAEFPPQISERTGPDAPGEPESASEPP
jgi:signal transduction histidine kinase